MSNGGRGNLRQNRSCAYLGFGALNFFLLFFNIYSFVSGLNHLVHPNGVTCGSLGSRLASRAHPESGRVWRWERRWGRDSVYSGLLVRYMAVAIPSGLRVAWVDFAEALHCGRFVDV